MFDLTRANVLTFLGLMADIAVRRSLREACAVAPPEVDRIRQVFDSRIIELGGNIGPIVLPGARWRRPVANGCSRRVARRRAGAPGGGTGLARRR